MKYWDRVIEEVRQEFPDVEYERMYVDAVAANLVLRPERFDVLLTTNMIGDILSDLGGALVGSLGLGPSGNLNPEREFPSMFEPIHGSAPDIAGRGIANPIGSIDSGALMLDHLGQTGAAERIRTAVAQALCEKIWTPDLGGTACTSEVGEAVIARM
jgi:tartrate dehydrogenase/decarboxylase/D-malate dehydrogenase